MCSQWTIKIELNLGLKTADTIAVNAYHDNWQSDESVESHRLLTFRMRFKQRFSLSCEPDDRRSDHEFVCLFSKAGYNSK